MAPLPDQTPTPAEFKTRFPVFTDREDAFVSMLLIEAGTYVGSDWRAQDQKIATMYMAAHLIATDNSDEDGEVDTGLEEIASESFGVLSIGYRAKAEALHSNLSGFNSTSYGRRYLGLLRRNKPAIMVV